MSRPFSLDSFFTHTATLKSRGSTIGVGGGIEQSESVVASFPVSLHTLSGSREQYAGSKRAVATHSVVTQEAQDVSNGDILSIGEVDYEIVYWDTVQSPSISYFEMELRVNRE